MSARGYLATRGTITATSATTSSSWHMWFLGSSGRTGSYFRKTFFLFSVLKFFQINKILILDKNGFSRVKY